MLLAGLVACDQGPDAVEELLAGALGAERARFEMRLSFLATLASNAPYVGLFGTVLGIVRAFRNLGADSGRGARGRDDRAGGGAGGDRHRPAGRHPGGRGVHAFKNALKTRVTRAETLSRTLLSRLKGELTVAETHGASLRAAAE